MYPFILNMWCFGKITESQVNNYAAKGFISQQDAKQILATPKSE